MMAALDSVRTTGFPCKQCGTVCPNMPSLLEHMDAHLEQEEERKFKCDVCGRGYRHAGSLANHKKTHEVGSFQCNVCGKEHSNALALKSHLRIHTSQKKHSCAECGKAFRLATQLATHEKVHFAKWEKEQTFSQVHSDFPVHKLDHDGLEALGEQPAVLSSPAEESMEAAQLENSADRPYRCDLCDKSYIHHRSLTNHKKTHQVGMFECTVCYKLFNNMSALYNHQRTHKARGDVSVASGSHAAATTPAGRFSPQTQDIPVNFCHLCQVLFPTDAKFQEHIQMHNSSSSLAFGLQDGLSESRHLAYDESLASPERSDFYASPINNAPSVSSVDSYTGFDLPDQPVGGSSLFSDCPGNLPLPCSNTQGEPGLLDPGVLGTDALDPAPRTHPSLASGATNGEDERPFRCQICGKSYRHSGSLINHKRSHQVGIYQCSVCRKSYPHLAALKSHLRLHRAQPSSFSLVAEGDWLSSEPQTLDSQQGGGTSRPSGMEASSPLSGFGPEQENGSGYSNGTSYDEHYHPDHLNHHVFSPDVAADLPQNHGPMQRHMCADCGETFQDIAGIKSHSCPLLLLQHHDTYDGSVDFRSTDPASDADYGGLNGHSDPTYIQQSFLECMGGEPLNGHLLEDGAGGSADVGDEEEEDEDGDLYQCSICGNSYTNMRALRSHLRGHTQSQGTPASSGPSSMSSHTDLRDDEFGEMIICSTCGESFSSRQDLMAHQLLHNQQQQQQQADQSSSLGCSSSPMRSSPPGSGVQEQSHSIICGSCGIFCSSYQHLENHGCSRAVKDEVKPQEVGNGAALQEEVGRVGEKDGGEQRQFRCEQCGRSYRHAGSLLNHKKSHKTGVFKCLVCQKRFYNLLALKNHQRSHFDVKRHTCPECGKAFKIQKQLLNHLRRHKENQAKIQELSTQIQALMQLNGTRLEAEVRPSAPAGSPDPKQQGRRQRGFKREDAQRQADQRPFSCEQCGRTYRHAGSLVNHRNSHKTGQYCCSVCSNTYSNQLAMKNHLRTHVAANRHSCPTCGKGFRGRKQLLAHECAPLRRSRSAGRRPLKARAFGCRRCGQAFFSAKQLATHACGRRREPEEEEEQEEEKEQEEEQRPFRCNVCGRSYRHAGSLLNHKNTHKTGHFSCTVCAKPFTNPMALRNHTRIHTQQKKHVCPTCGKAFRLASILHSHQRVHSRPADSPAHLACAACGKSFRGHAGLRRHRCVQVQVRGRGAGQGGEQRGHRGEKCFTCDLCGRSYRHAGSLLNHKRSHSESLHQCALCLQTFADPVTLQLHAAMTRHCCPECGKTFCLVAHLQSHMDVHARERSAAGGGAGGGAPRQPRPHRASEPPPPPLSHPPDGLGGARRHVCEHCGRAYRHAGSLLNHKYSHRTGSFSCAACSKHFSNLMALRNHRRIHTEPKRYQCAECGKAFRVSTQLLCHRRIHTKERPFGCPLCGRSFSSKSNLRHHQRLHGGGGAGGGATGAGPESGAESAAAYHPAFSAHSFMDDLDMDAFL